MVGYPFVVVRGEGRLRAVAVQWRARMVADEVEVLRQRMARAVSRFLVQHVLAGTRAPAPLARDELDVAALGGEAAEVVFAVAAPVSGASVAIARALAEEGVSRAELARRLEVAPSVVGRLVSPFYFGHSLPSLRRVAQVLGRQVVVRLEPEGDDVALAII